MPARAFLYLIERKGIYFICNPVVPQSPTEWSKHSLWTHGARGCVNME